MVVLTKKTNSIYSSSIHPLLPNDILFVLYVKCPIAKFLNCVSRSHNMFINIHFLRLLGRLYTSTRRLDFFFRHGYIRIIYKILDSRKAKINWFPTSFPLHLEFSLAAFSLSHFSNSFHQWLDPKVLFTI